MNGVAGPIGRRDLVRAEVTKGLTDPAVARAVVGALVVHLGLAVVSRADVVRLWSGDRPVALSDVGMLMLAPLDLFLVVPVHLGGGEYVSGQLRVTLATVPDRRRLLMAKLGALAAVVVPSAVAVLVPGRLVVTMADGLSPGQVALDLARYVAAYTLMSGVAYALAVLLRNRVAPLAVLVLAPLLPALGLLPWPAVVRLLPDRLALGLAGTPALDASVLDGTALPAPIAGVLLGCWATTLLVAQALAVLRRDS